MSQLRYINKLASSNPKRANRRFLHLPAGCSAQSPGDKFEELAVKVQGLYSMRPEPGGDIKLSELFMQKNGNSGNFLRATNDPIFIKSIQTGVNKTGPT